ncbi:hypothetical protein OPV22_032818 [Ensete ventricosum]|uniref:BZIP domain-containing protein n=1 Tax=Ensete ventricosum TaxID=4639 RepID=A0AAV8PWG8_ENSVE|nr:hypothetical protein OPV22_032818 [Ensete ventricosum]
MLVLVKQPAPHVMVVDVMLLGVHSIRTLLSNLDQTIMMGMLLWTCLENTNMKTEPLIPWYPTSWMVISGMCVLIACLTECEMFEVARIWYLSPSNLPSFQAHYNEEDEDKSSLIEERRKRRMISNRESARRSRMRQQKQFNQLWSLVIHFQSVNHQLLQKVNIMMKECHHILHENIKLRDEKLELLKELENLAAEYNCVSQA